MIAAMDPFRVGLASRTLARSAQGTNGDHQTGPIAAGAVYNKASGNQCRRFERSLHDVDSFRRTNPSLRPNCIKSESEPLLRANLQAGPQCASRTLAATGFSDTLRTRIFLLQSPPQQHPP